VLGVVHQARGDQDGQGQQVQRRNEGVPFGINRGHQVFERGGIVRQLQDAHDPDHPQKPQIHAGQQGLQEEGQNGEQVDQAMKTQHVSQATTGDGLSGVSGFFCGGPDAQQVLRAEKDDGQCFKARQCQRVLGIDGGHRGQDHGRDIPQHHQGQHP
jgi:hypothetical protein